MNLKYLIVFLALIPITYGIETNVTIFCMDSDGTPCDTTTVCTANIFDIDFTPLIGPQNMTFISNGYYNITIDLSVGKYPSYATCIDTNNVEKSVDMTFQIGADMVFETASVLGLGILSFLFIFVGNNMRTNQRFQFLFLSAGLFSLILMISTLIEIASINGQSTIQNYMALGLLIAGTITLTVVFFFLIKLVVEVLEQAKGIGKTKMEREIEKENGEFL